MKANACKCHLFLSIYQPVPVNYRGFIIESINFEKFLAIYIDCKFSFEYHIYRICHKGSQKLHALSRIEKYVSKDKKCMLFKSLIIAQFNNCPTIWMCHSRGLHNRVNNIHEKTFWVAYQDSKSSFETLLNKTNSTSTHIENLQYLATEFFFQGKKISNLRSCNHLV